MVRSGSVNEVEGHWERAGEEVVEGCREQLVKEAGVRLSGGCCQDIEGEQMSVWED